MGQQRLSKEQELQLVEDYRNGATVKSLMAKYGFASKKSIIDKVKKYYPNEYQQIIEEAKNGRKNYNYSLEKIQSDFDAYFLGLLLTDGYIARGREVGIDLTDEDCISFLSQTIGKEYKVYIPTEQPEREIQGKKNRYRLIISDAKLVADIARLGVLPNKTYDLQGPELKPYEFQFIPYIIRGIIDGDGCIFETSYGAPAFYICSQSKAFIDWVIDILVNKMYMKDIHLTISPTGLYRAETANQDNILKLISLSYDKPFGMSRKYEKLRKTFRDYNSDLLLRD